ncbi:putative tetratricopeptide-like helical domain superfamily [Helianthus annuus]|nr:putative tetratricopeptide-like helical domain superfamily [Helianthus annuus]KAJ0619391.1 putative tetratricopeptide-like helical domain superfamily [Helianthus annuus]
MQVNGVKPDIFSLNTLIENFCRIKDVKKTQRVLLTMLTLGLTLDNFTYSAFVKMCDLGRYIEAKELFHLMDANGCIPDSFTCNLFIDDLVQSGRFVEARDVFLNYKEKRILLKPISILK